VSEARDDIAATREVRAVVDRLLEQSRPIRARVAESAYMDACDDQWLALRSERLAQLRALRLHGIRAGDALLLHFATEAAAHQLRRDGEVTATKILGDLLGIASQHVVGNLTELARELPK
jgi:hypothetical protein